MEILSKSSKDTNEASLCMQPEAMFTMFTIPMQLNFDAIVVICDLKSFQTINRNYSPYKVMWQIPKLIITAYKKNVYCSKLILLQSFYRVEWSILLKGDVYLIIDTCTVITFLSQCVNGHSFTYYLITYVSSFNQLNCLLMSEEICKECREY